MVVNTLLPSDFQEDQRFSRGAASDAFAGLPPVAACRFCSGPSLVFPATRSRCQAVPWAGTAGSGSGGYARRLFRAPAEPLPTLSTSRFGDFGVGFVEGDDGKAVKAFGIHPRGRRHRCTLRTTGVVPALEPTSSFPHRLSVLLAADGSLLFSLRLHGFAWEVTVRLATRQSKSLGSFPLVVSPACLRAVRFSSRFRVGVLWVAAAALPRRVGRRRFPCLPCLCFSPLSLLLCPRCFCACGFLLRRSPRLRASRCCCCCCCSHPGYRAG